MTVFEAVAGCVTARDAAKYYSMKFGRNGRAVCVWHNDMHPDLAFYDNRCFCHCCHNGGDSIALTAQIFNLSMMEAARRLNADFKLGIDLDAPSMSAEPTKAQVQQCEREQENRLWGKLCEVEREADARLRKLCEGCEDYDRLWDDPRFTKALEARSRASLALENMRAKE